MHPDARGRVSAAKGDPAAPRALGLAVTAFTAQSLPLDAARARFELARALELPEPEVALGEAKTALAEFERLGAPRDADRPRRVGRGRSPGASAPVGHFWLAK